MKSAVFSMSNIKITRRMQRLVLTECQVKKKM